MGWWDDITGKSARRDNQAAYDASTGMLQQGYDTARTDLTGGRDRAIGTLDPFVQGGTRVNSLLLDYLGANGPEAQRVAFANFQQDPGWQQQLDAGVNALDRSATARGGLYSGAAMKGVAQYGQQFQRQAFNDRINALSGQAGQGLQAAGTAAGIESDTGARLGDLSWGFGQQRAANRINLGNANAQSRGTLLNNLLAIGGTAARIGTAMSGGGR